MNVKPKFDCPHSPQPLVRSMKHTSAVLMPGKMPNCGQSDSFCLGHGSRRVRSRLLGGQTFHQSPRFLIGANRGDLQNRFAVTGLNEALVVAHLNEATHCTANAAWVGGAVEQSKDGLIQRDKHTVCPYPIQSSDSSYFCRSSSVIAPTIRAHFDVGDAVGRTSSGTPPGPSEVRNFRISTETPGGHSEFSPCNGG